MASPKQAMEQQPQLQIPLLKNSGMINYSGNNPMGDDKAEEMTKTALSTFRAKEEEIERRRKEVTDRVQAQLGRMEEESKRLAEIREARLNLVLQAFSQQSPSYFGAGFAIQASAQHALEGFVDPAGKEAAMVRKKIDVVNRELKSLGQTCQRKEKEYKETLDAFNGKSKEKAQLITKLMELVSESERMRMKKLEELSKNVDSLC